MAMDFSKAFDRVRHFALIQKMPRFELLHQVYNWLADFVSDNSHCVNCRGDTSGLLEITATTSAGATRVVGISRAFELHH
jgi:hypothetical protein